MEMTQYSQDQTMTIQMEVMGTMNYTHRTETTCSKVDQELTSSIVALDLIQ